MIFDSPSGIIPILGLVIVLPFAVVAITAFAKIVVVFFLLRNALGIQQSPPNMVVNGVSLILTAYIMAPVIEEVWAIVQGSGLDMSAPEQWPQLLEAGSQPVKEFLRRFTDEADRAFFVDAAQRIHGEDVDFGGDDLLVLAPAFLTAELTKAFQIGVLIFLPFVVLDMVVSVLLTALGMMMVSPTIISLPFKLLLFVAVDGWTRLTHALILSYA